MKKVRTIKIAVTAREIIIPRSGSREILSETEFPLCPACHSQIAEAVGAAMAALPESEAPEIIEIQKGDK